MQDKVVLITGGAKRVGAVIARRLHAAGARLMLHYRSSEAEAEALKNELNARRADSVSLVQADLLDIAGLAEMVKNTVARFEHLDVLINNAALRNLDPVAEADDARWQALLQVNLMGAVHCSRAALPALRRQGRSSIVNVSSTYAVVGRKGFAAYDASKAALLSLTRSLAWEEAAHGVRVNAVCPGGTLTPYTIGRAAQRGLSETALRADSKADTLLKRWAEPMEVAWPVLWLASEEASFVTGTSLMVDGGTAVM